MRPRALRQILTFQSALVALLPFVVVAVLVAVWFLPQLRAELETSQGRLAQTVASQADAYLNSSLRAMQDLAGLMAFEEKSGGHWQQILDLHVRPDSAMQAVYIAGTDGRIKALAVASQGQAQRDDLLGLDLSHNALLRQARQKRQPLWSDTFLSVVGGGLAVALAVPAGGSTVIGELRMPDLIKHLQQISTMPEQLVLVIDRRGQVIADQEGRYSAQQLNISDIPLVGQALAGSVQRVGELEFAGQTMMGSLVKAPSLDWYVLVALPTRLAYQPLWTVTGIFGVALILTMMAGMALAVLLGRRLAGRFESLAANARLIAMGQDPGQWPVSAVLEFRALAQDLRHMAKAVHERQLSLSLSEAKFRRLAQSSPLGLHLYQLLPDGRLILSEANAAAAAMLGQDHRPLLGMEFHEAFPGLAGGDASWRLRAVASEGGLWQDEQLVYEHGEHRAILELRAFQGEPSQVAVLFNDITQRRQAEQAVRQSEATLRGIYRASPAGIGIVSYPGRRVQWANQSMVELIGYSMEEFLGMASRDAYPSQEEYDRAGALIDQGMRHQGVASLETRLVRRDGSLMDVLIKAAPLDSQNWSSGLVFMVLDITESKRLAQEKAELEARLRQAQKIEALGTLSGGIAHDFNNILAIIMGNADMAIEEAPPQGPLAEMLSRIQSACQRGKGLVNQILSFSRRRERQALALDPAVVWKETLKLLKSTLPAHIKIEHHLASGVWQVMADPTELHQMLMNLGTNAAHALGGQGGAIDVRLGEITLERNDTATGLPPGRYVKLSVGDNGPGMDQATQERVFEPYFSTKPAGQGTGLGLAVVHGLAQSLGGAVSVRSQPGQGATFEICLPVNNKVDEQPCEQEPSPTRGSGRVLLVDDEPEVLMLGQRFLGRLGYTVETQTDGAQAWRAFQANPQAFDLVVTDQAMPNMTGLMLAREIRKLAPTLPIILCTGFMEASLDGEVQELCIAEVINKPYSKVRLASAVQRALAAGAPASGDPGDLPV